MTFQQFCKKWEGRGYPIDFLKNEWRNLEKKRKRMEKQLKEEF